MDASVDGREGCDGLSSRAGAIIETASCEQQVIEQSKSMNELNRCRFGL